MSEEVKKLVEELYSEMGLAGSCWFELERVREIVEKLHELVAGAEKDE